MKEKCPKFIKKVLELMLKHWWYVFFVDYYGAAEPPVRCGVSHLSELTEPLLEIAI